MAQLESHKQPPASFLNDDSIYYVNTVSEKRKFNIKIQVADHILMCINVECKLKGGGGQGQNLIRVKHEKFVAI